MPKARAPMPQRPEAPPDPFSDIVAPPLRLGRPPAPSPSRAAIPLRPVTTQESAPMHPAAPAPPPLGGAGEASEAAAALDPRARAEPPAAGRAPGTDPAPDTEPVCKAALAPPPPFPAALRRRRNAGLAQLRLAVALGLVLALALVAAALLFRPTAPGTVSSEPAPAMAAPVAPEPTPVSEISVRLRLGPTLPETRQAALREAVLAAGFAAADRGALPLTASRAQVAYFHAADRAAAEALAAALAPLAGNLDLRDLSAVGGAAQPGRVEVWLPE